MTKRKKMKKKTKGRKLRENSNFTEILKETLGGKDTINIFGRKSYNTNRKNR